MKKKILMVLLSVCLAGTLAGCSPKEISNEYITITQYKGLEVPEVEKTEVTDEMVTSEIESRLSAQSETETVTDRAAEEGDTVNIDFTGRIDGTEFEGGSAQGVNLEIGSGAMIGANGDYKGFEEQLIGHKPGDTFTITTQFPDEYENSPDKAGKVAEFDIVLNEISVITEPELSDEWVKENSEESKTVDEFKEEVRAELQATYDESAEYTLQSEALQALVEKTEVTKFPEGEVEEQEQEIRSYYESMATMYDMEFAELLETYMGTTEEDFDGQVRTIAENTVKQRLAVALLAEEKNLIPSDAEYEEAFEQYAKDYGFGNTEDMLEQVGEDALKELVLQEAVGEYLAESCVQVEGSAEE